MIDHDPTKKEWYLYSVIEFIFGTLLFVTFELCGNLNILTWLFSLIWIILSITFALEGFYYDKGGYIFDRKR